jgi:hypothetical protein
MNKVNKKTVLSTKEQILKIIKNRQIDTIFTYKVFRLIENKNALRSVMSRFEKDGTIVKLEDGVFYRPKQICFIKPSVKEYKINKALFVHDHFWSVGDKSKVSIDQLIEAYVLHPNSDDIYTIYKLFGYKRVRSILEKAYKKLTFNDDGVIRKHPSYKLALSVLRSVEKERFNDK